MNSQISKQDGAQEAGRSSLHEVLADDEVLEALKECEFALQEVLRVEKVGWLQEEAHKTAHAVLEKVRKQKRKSANDLR